MCIKLCERFESYLTYLTVEIKTKRTHMVHVNGFLVLMTCVGYKWAPLCSEWEDDR